MSLESQRANRKFVGCLSLYILTNITTTAEEQKGEISSCLGWSLSFMLLSIYKRSKKHLMVLYPRSSKDVSNKKKRTKKKKKKPSILSASCPLTRPARLPTATKWTDNITFLYWSHGIHDGSFFFCLMCTAQVEGRHLCPLPLKERGNSLRCSNGYHPSMQEAQNNINLCVIRLSS